MTKLEIAEATVMSLRPVGADYLGVVPHASGHMATMREIDGEERRGIGATPFHAVVALIAWYRPDDDPRPHDVVYEPQS